jgi:hypothetical protein
MNSEICWSAGWDNYIHVCCGGRKKKFSDAHFVSGATAQTIHLMLYWSACK